MHSVGDDDEQLEFVVMNEKENSNKRKRNSNYETVEDALNFKKRKQSVE